MALLKLLKIHDLTRTISQDIRVYPGEPQPTFTPHATIKDNNANVTRITLGSHTGTHVDAPWHFLQEGKSIDMEPLDKFIGEAAIIDAYYRKKMCNLQGTMNHAHYCSDFPNRDDRKWRVNIYCRNKGKKMVLVSRRTKKIKESVKDLLQVRMKVEHHLLE
jgi:kynurenine formamidase